jgi:hypothetical protein
MMGLFVRRFSGGIMSQDAIYPATMECLSALLLILQTDVSIGFGASTAAGVGMSAIGAFLGTLIAGEVVLSSRLERLSQSMSFINEHPLRSFGIGVVPFVVGAVVVLVFPSFTIALVVGVAVYALWSIGAAVASLTIAERIVGRDEDWTKPLVVGAVFIGGLTLTGIGGIIAFCIGAAGLGAALETRSGGGGTSLGTAAN